VAAGSLIRENSCKKMYLVFSLKKIL